MKSPSATERIGAPTVRELIEAFWVVALSVEVTFAGRAMPWAKAVFGTVML
jgi:hypothetical protein